MTKIANYFDDDVAAATDLPSSDDEVEQLIEDGDTLTENELEAAFQQKFTIQDESALTLKKDYVLCLNADSAFTRLVVGLSNASVQLFDINAQRSFAPTLIDVIPTPVITNPEEPVNVCGVRFLDETSNSLLVGTTNGQVRLFDLRTCKQEACFEHDAAQTEVAGAPQGITCFDANANARVICTGTEQHQHNVFLLFYDVRKRKQMGGYFESHQDDVTAIRFHKQNPDILCTGSTDGLINVFDIKETSEDDALLNTMNTESSVHKLQWHKDVYEKDIISCITHTNYLAYESQEGDEIFNFTRPVITAGIRRRNASNFNLINAHNTADDGIFLLAGTNFNKGDVLRSVRVVNKNTLEPLANFVGNKQIVRDSIFNAQQNLLITGGESGIVTLWAAQKDDVASSSSSSKLKVKTKSKTKKATPY